MSKELNTAERPGMPDIGGKESTTENDCSSIHSSDARLYGFQCFSSQNCSSAKYYTSSLSIA
jgi:hypothetical protein